LQHSPHPLWAPAPEILGKRTYPHAAVLSYGASGRYMVPAWSCFSPFSIAKCGIPVPLSMPLSHTPGNQVLVHSFREVCADPRR
jgi:hypothetical protein